MGHSRLLKKDLFGEVWERNADTGTVIVRDTRPARWWLRWIARALLRREVRALSALRGLDGVPELQSNNRHELVRSFVKGVPMHVGKPTDDAYFQSAARLLRKMHRAGVVHNDLAKEPNLIVRDDGTPGFIDFQLAWHSVSRGKLFRIAGHEDIRHLLKHKRTYRPDDLSRRERRILDNPSPLSRAYMATIKPVYVFVTRRLFGWADREGAGDRGVQG